MATTLAAGDIAVVNYNADDPDTFAFVLLRDIEAGTTINFTDNGWKAAGGFLASEGTTTYTAGADVAAGTVIEITAPGIGAVAFNVNGDQIIAYQGTAGSPTFIYAADFADSNETFAGDATDTLTSALPTGLTLGETALAFGSDNGTYTGPTSGTRAELLAAIADPTNWTLNSTTRQPAPAGPFTITGALAQDDDVTTAENAPVSGDVFADNGSGEDTDTGGGTLVIAEVNGVAADVGAEITLASGALLTLNADGTFSYDPNGKFDHLPGSASGATNATAEDSFTYTLDGGNTATVTVTVSGVDTDGDVLAGDASDNTLDGGIGADTMDGGAGNDLYYVNHAGDTVIEAAAGGTDRIAVKGISYTLADGLEIELLTTNSTSSTLAIDLRGNALSQTIVGNNGNNFLHDGGTGPGPDDGSPDTLRGLGGNDTYAVYDSEAVVIELADQGTDRVAAGVDYVLAEGVHVELLNTTALHATYSVDLTGNSFVQVVRGNDGTNRLDGGGGSDTLHGGLGADTFVFSTALGSGNVDTIGDFTVADDTIELSAAIFTALGGSLDPAAFLANSTGLAEASDDRIIYNMSTGELFYDADGSGGGAGIHFATLNGLPGLTATDFTVSALV
ncbi:calcium-binding protein [Kumtagia ephedrae]|uniref:RapA2 cadherin-like domain-containing protein n=1 Tax=Kumtagia ephedrae TaxID=2116701 RepID=A0A2P7SDI7_9HYPH|nr:calcium-binding protein [Mesorhizobium ephedrae]PSJ60564.1 hypothetical protein C7I84_11355 [Mesorhizobium ephedrae]